jgi:glycosyltransferase involved in cell wall biosynthesis
MKKKIRFSIITPVYNRSDCIVHCIESVLNQDYLSYEIIIINDGSSDSTLQKIREEQSKSTVINVISYEQNKGVNYARNRGIEHAKGDFIIFLDSDDCLAINALKNIDKNIHKYLGYDHYLFGVSDRANDPLVPTVDHEYIFADWLSEKVNGDFAHVIRPSCFENLMFIEKFRIYESLNWMRVLRKNKAQLFIPIIVSIRERDRSDSVSNEHSLNNKSNIQNTYNFFCLYIDWYAKDFNSLGLESKLQSYINKAIILGFALGEQHKNAQLITQIQNTGIRRTGFKLLNKFPLKFIFYRLILISSFYGQFKRKYFYLFHK